MPTRFLPKGLRDNAMLATLLFIVFIDILGFAICMPVVTPMFLSPQNGILPQGTSLADREMMIGIVIALYPIFQFFASPVLGALSDTYGRKRLLAYSLVGTCLSHVLFAIGIMAGNLALVLASRILDGITSSSVTVVYSAVADISTKQDKVKNFGLVGTAWGVAFLIGPVLGGILSDPHIVSWFGYATPFWFAAALTAANFVLMVCLFRETRPAKAARKPIDFLSGVRQVVKACNMPSLRPLFAVIFLFSIGSMFYWTLFQLMLGVKFGYSSSQIGIALAYAAFWSILSQTIVLGWVSRNRPPLKMLAYSLPATAVAFFLLAVPSQDWAIYLVIPLVEISLGVAIASYIAQVSNAAPKGEQGEVMGITQALRMLGGTMPPIVGGMMASAFIEAPMVAASIAVLLSWAVFMAYEKKVRENPRATAAPMRLLL